MLTWHARIYCFSYRFSVKVARETQGKVVVDGDDATSKPES